MARYPTDMDYWVQEFKDSYLPTVRDSYEAESEFGNLIERAIESFESDLRAALHEATDEWFDAECVECDGTGECLYCTGTGECSTYRGEDDDHKANDEYDNDCIGCGGTNVCDECEGSGECTVCNGSGKEHPERD